MRNPNFRKLTESQQKVIVDITNQVADSGEDCKIIDRGDQLSQQLTGEGFYYCDHGDQYEYKNLENGIRLATEKADKGGLRTPDDICTRERAEWMVDFEEDLLKFRSAMLHKLSFCAPRGTAREQSELRRRQDIYFYQNLLYALVIRLIREGFQETPEDVGRLFYADIEELQKSYDKQPEVFDIEFWWGLMAEKYEDHRIKEE